ncbi:MAG: helix-turn-helix domain-containing protein [Dysgonamonadaceae bacterium]|jgi:transcriptional regulator with XRE-family HTH domain|nr:helix-turn-helix domain-containing protein [Dysgonamonadaceae bacterium]
MSIGKKVRQYRELKDLSQTDLAIMADISQSVVSSLESDKTIPNSIMLHRIAKVLEVDINELLKDDSIVQYNSDSATGNIHKIQNQTIHNNFPENVLEVLMSNQEKITDLLENQNKLIDALLKK